MIYIKLKIFRFNSQYVFAVKKTNETTLRKIFKKFSYA